MHATIDRVIRSVASKQPLTLPSDETLRASVMAHEEATSFALHLLDNYKSQLSRQVSKAD